MSLHLPKLGADPSSGFPEVSTALRPDGLLAFGGDLSPVRLIDAYSRGIFPWFSEGQPILWWSPDPRVVFDTTRFRLPTRFRRQLRKSRWTVRADTAFDDVITACATVPRPGQRGTWITDAMQSAYRTLHVLGHAHSVEVFDGADLVGGIYGVAVGRMFFGESMFSARSGGSKVALAALARWLAARGWPLIDAQVENEHLLSLGATSWPRTRFVEVVRGLAEETGRIGSWTHDFGGRPANTLSESCDAPVLPASAPRAIILR